MKTLKRYDSERERKVMKWIICFLLGIIAIMWIHFVWRVPMPACERGTDYPCSL